MGQYLWEADSFNVGETPVGDWEEAVNITSFTIQEDGDGKHLEVVNDGSRSCLRFRPTGSGYADVELYLSGKYTGEDDDIWYYLRGTNDSTSWDHEMLRGDVSGLDDEMGLSEFHSEGSHSTLDRIPLTIDPGELFHVRLRVDGNEAFYGKYWTGSAADEPAEWDVSVTDFENTGSGWIGTGGWDSATHHVYSVGVGTEGDEAPTPVPDVQTLNHFDGEQWVEGPLHVKAGEDWIPVDSGDLKAHDGGQWI